MLHHNCDTQGINHPAGAPYYVEITQLESGTLAFAVFSVAPHTSINVGSGIIPTILDRSENRRLFG